MHTCLWFFFLCVQFVSESFQPRTRETHASHCAALSGPLHSHFATRSGLHRNSILNSSQFFHVTEGLVPDLMHDVLEGCLPYEVKELLKYIVHTKVISCSELDGIIQSFPYLGLDKQNKPSPISPATLASTDHNLKQTGQSFVYMYILCVCIIICIILYDSVKYTCYGSLYTTVFHILRPSIAVLVAKTHSVRGATPNGSLHVGQCTCTCTCTCCSLLPDRVESFVLKT